MDFGKIIGDSFGYAKEGLVGKWVTWILLIISCIIFPLIMGYLVRIYRGADKPPELNEWGSMFIDGLKLFVVSLIYAIPVVILAVVVFGSAIITAVAAKSPEAMSNPSALMGLFGAFLFGLIVLILVAFIIDLIWVTAVVRFARKNSIGEAFNFGAIFHHIGKIGIVSYILAIIIMGIILGLIELICMNIPVIGLLLFVIILPVLALFKGRYFALLYESAAPE